MVAAVGAAPEIRTLVRVRHLDGGLAALLPPPILSRAMDQLILTGIMSHGFLLLANRSPCFGFYIQSTTPYDGCQAMVVPLKVSPRMALRTLKRSRPFMIFTVSRLTAAAFAAMGSKGAFEPGYQRSPTIAR